MNIQSNTAPDSSLDSQRSDPATLSPGRLMCWSLQRELWENRSIYVAPLAVAAVYLLGFLISLVFLPRRPRELSAFDPAQQLILAMPYSHAAMLLMAVALVVGIFYCLDGLHGERRDRSILFWKSLPVSDLTTVLSKATVPLVVLPLLVFALTVSLQIDMRILSAAVVLVSGAGIATPWGQLLVIDLTLFYSLIVFTLWLAPLYMWLLLVSGWARRAAFVWAVLPPLVVVAFEKIAFHTSYLGSLLIDRCIGFAARAFDLRDKNGVALDPHFIPLAQLAPARFFSSPSLWIGLIFAAAFVAAAVRLRRYREPI
jgi:ABC-2 type transport system permease protein